jgi:hypothetical protein
MTGGDVDGDPRRQCGVTANLNCPLSLRPVAGATSDLHELIRFTVIR